MKRLILVFLVIAFLVLHLFFNYDLTVLAVDVYGNDINFVEVWEDTALKLNFSSSGGTVKVDAGKTLKFVVGIKFNSTLASSSDEAVSYTRVYMNISGVWVNKELNNTSVVLSGGFYWLKEEAILAANTLSEGQTYECSILYEGDY